MNVLVFFHHMFDRAQSHYLLAKHTFIIIWPSNVITIVLKVKHAVYCCILVSKTLKSIVPYCSQVFGQFSLGEHYIELSEGNFISGTRGLMSLE